MYLHFPQVIISFRLPVPFNFCAGARFISNIFLRRSSCALHGVFYVARLQIDVVTAISILSLVLLAFWMNCVRKRKFNNNNKKIECTWDILLHAVMCVGWLAGRSKDQWLTIAFARSRFSEFNYNFHRQPTHEGVKKAAQLRLFLSSSAWHRNKTAAKCVAGTKAARS